MKRVLWILSLSVMLMSCNSIPTTNGDADMNINQIAPYPSAQPGYSRFVIYLPKLAQELDYKVDLVIGKNMLTDCNKKHLLGRIKKYTIPGWGYSYYVVESNGDAVSTLKACPSNEEHVQFVTIPNNIGLINYNSRLPIVIYTPDDFQARYRIWSSTRSNRTLEAEKQ